jgi:uncharacterized integral membrane protein
MLSLIVMILFALAIAYFAIQNTLGVTLVIANNVITNVPLFAIVIGSVLLGVLISSVISGLNTLSAYMQLRGKDHVIQEDAKAIHLLQNQIHELEVENTRLKTEKEETHTEVVEAEHVDKPIHRPSYVSQLFHPRT